MKYVTSITLLILINCSLFAQSQVSESSNPMEAKAELYPTTSMIKINRKKIPDDLKFTLMNVSYVGWEKGEVYQDTITNDYALLIPDKYKVYRAKAETPISDSSVWHCFTNEGRPFPCSLDKIN